MHALPNVHKNDACQVKKTIRHVVNIYGGSSIAGNTAIYGGGIYNGHSVHMNTGSSITGNNAYRNGGGIYNNGGRTVNMNGGSISRNTASRGGAIYNEPSATVNLKSVSITNNTASNDGGGIYNENGGFLNLAGTSQISKNQATTGYGGGIYSSSSRVTFDGTQVVVRSNKAHLPSPSESSWYQGRIF